MRLPSGTFFSDRGITVLACVEVLGVVVFAGFLATLALAVIAPLGPIGAARPVAAAAIPQPDFGVLQRFDPFYRAAAFAAPQTLSAESLGLRLYGVRGGGRPERGTAIISANDGPQVAIRVGESPVPGVVLREVLADHVILDRGGARLRLGFPPRIAGPTLALPPQDGAVFGAAGGPGVPAAPVVAVPAPVPEGRAVEANFARFLTEASLVPRRVGNAVTGYRIETAGAAPEVARIGLQAGDILTELNGAPLSSAEPLEELPGILAQGGEITLRFERGGAVRSIRVKGAALKGR